MAGACLAAAAVRAPAPQRQAPSRQPMPRRLLTPTLSQLLLLLLPAAHLSRRASSLRYLSRPPRVPTPRRTTTPGGDASIVGVTLTEESNNPRGGRTGRSCGGGRRARGVEPADSLTGPLRGGGRASPPRRRADDLLAEAHRSRAVRCDKPGDDVSAVWRCPSVSAQFLEFQLESFEWVGRLHFWPRKKHGTSHQAGASSSNRCLARARDGGRGRARWRGREEEEKER